MRRLARNSVSMAFTPLVKSIPGSKLLCPPFGGQLHQARSRWASSAIRSRQARTFFSMNNASGCVCGTRTVLDTYVQTPQTHPLALFIEKKVRAWRDLIAEEAQRDRAWWSWPPKGGQSNFDPGIDLTNGVNAMLTEFVAKRRIHYYGKHSITNTALPVGITKTSNAGIPLAQPTNATIAINAVEYDPASHI